MVKTKQRYEVEDGRKVELHHWLEEKLASMVDVSVVCLWMTYPILTCAIMICAIKKKLIYLRLIVKQVISTWKTSSFQTFWSSIGGSNTIRLNCSSYLTIIIQNLQKSKNSQEEIYLCVLQKDKLLPDVFISYCWSNSRLAQQKSMKMNQDALGYGDPREIRNQLENEGAIHCWIDTEYIGKEKVFLFVCVFMPPPFEEWWRGIKCYPCPCVRSCVCASVGPKFGVRSITFERLHRFNSNLVYWYIISQHRSSLIWVTIH